MKKLIIALSLGLATAIFSTHTVEAQHVSVNINLDIQPAWGPSGYNYASYYYLPALNIYYDINNGLFIYLNGRNWVTNFYLPKKYRKYDLYMMHKVVLNDIYNPWMHNPYHRQHYAHYRNSRSQMSIYYMNDRRYHRAKQNHWAWVEPKYMPKQNNQKHLAHQHKPVQVNNNQGRSTTSNSKTTPPRNQNQVTNNNNRNTQRSQQATAGTNRADSRSSSSAKSNDTRSSANKQQSDVRKSQNKQVEKSDNRSTNRSGQSASSTKCTDNKSSASQSSNTRSKEKSSSVEKKSEKTENKSRSGGR